LFQKSLNVEEKQVFPFLFFDKIIDRLQNRIEQNIKKDNNNNNNVYFPQTDKHAEA
jgi:hypothetical protein